MTRTELMYYATNNMPTGFAPYGVEVHSIDGCKATIITDSNTGYALIVSYNTVVGIYSDRTATLYAFDRYSTTTQQHIRKAAKLLGAMRITYLYRRSDGVIEEALSEYAITIKLTEKEFRIVEEYDFMMYIENMREEI